MKQFQMFSVLRQSVVSISLFVLCSTGYALELDQYVTDVIDANPIIKEKVHVYRQTLQDYEASKSGWRPSVDLEGSISHTESDVLTNNSQSADYNSNVIALSVTQNLFNGFDTEHGLKQAEARVNSALYDLYDTIDNIALEAVQSYLNVIRQKLLYELALENVASHEETLRQIKIRSESGAGRRSEQEQTEGRVARARASLISQHNNLNDALTELHEILGRYMSLDSFLSPEIPKEMDASLQESINAALLDHPAIKVARYNIEAARYDHKRSQSAFMPNLDVRLAQEISDNIDDSRDNDDELTLSLNLRYNLYNGGADRAERNKRVSAISEQQQFASRVRRQIINTLSLAWNADQLLQQQLKYLDQHVLKAQETVLSYQEEFYAGERDLIDMLDAKNEVNSAKNSYTEAFYDAVIARYRAYEGVGKLFDALGVAVVVDKDRLEISKLSANGADQIVEDEDLNFDVDSVPDVMDHCDNSVQGAEVNQYGCTGVESVAEYRVNTAPVANDDEFDVSMNGAEIIPVSELLANDSDKDMDALELVRFTQPVSGQVALDESGQLVYRSAEGFFGKDQFTYSVADQKGAMSSATVVVSIPNEVVISSPQFVNFEYNSVELTDGSQKIVDRIAVTMNENPDLAIKFLSHSDHIGSHDFNMSISVRRAKAVQDQLYSKGVERKRVTLIPMGETDPIADNKTEEGRAINRRGEFVFVVNSKG